MSFAQDNPSRVFVNLTQSAQIAPDIYILTLTISTEADNEIKALSLLGRMDRELSQLGLSYSGGNYWVEANSEAVLKIPHRGVPPTSKGANCFFTLSHAPSITSSTA